MSIALIKRLKTFNQEELERIYQNCFSTDSGQLVLEDLKGRFWEYAPSPGDRCAGQEDVVKHIKNMIEPFPKDEESPDGI